MSVPAEATVTPTKIVRVLRTRRWWLVAGVALGIVVALIFLQVAPTQHRATAVINITAVSADPAPEDKAPSSLLDMSTELQLAGSAITADLAAQSLGQEWSSDVLREGLEVTGDADGTIVRISYADIDPQRAVQGADAVAAAYLQVRTLLVGERAAAVGSSLDQQIEVAQGQLAAALQQKLDAGTYDNAAQSEASAAEETARIQLQTLSNRRVTLYDMSAVAGQIITPAAQNAVYTSPAKRTVLAGGLLGGAFLGLLLVLLRQGLARRPVGAEEIEETLGVPVWTPDGALGRSIRWAAAAEAAAWAVGDEPATGVVLADLGGWDSRAAAEAVASVCDAVIVDLRRSRARMLRAMRGRRSVVLVASPRWEKNRYDDVVRDIDSVGCELVGIALAAPDTKRPDADPQHRARKKTGSAREGGSAPTAASAPTAVSAPAAAAAAAAAPAAVSQEVPAPRVASAPTTVSASAAAAAAVSQEVPAPRAASAPTAVSAPAAAAPAAAAAAAPAAVSQEVPAPRVASAPTTVSAPASPAVSSVPAVVAAATAATPPTAATPEASSAPTPTPVAGSAPEVALAPVVVPAPKAASTPEVGSASEAVSAPEAASADGAGTSPDEAAAAPTAPTPAAAGTQADACSAPTPSRTGERIDEENE